MIKILQNFRHKQQRPPANQHFSFYFAVYHPTGAPCSIVGAWNSQVIGMKLNISLAAGSTQKLVVSITAHDPPRTDALLDSTWNCTGFALYSQGGPFYLRAIKEPMLASFSGVCRTCGGVDTIFGLWTFVHPPNDCRDVQMFAESRRDIFRQDVIHLRKQKAGTNEGNRKHAA